jgi:hypothetical protein
MTVLEEPSFGHHLLGRVGIERLAASRHHAALFVQEFDCLERPGREWATLEFFDSAHTVRSICSPAVSAFLRYEMLSSLSAPSVFIGVIEAFASDFRNCVDYLAALIALFSARNQANPPPCFLVTGKAKRGCLGSVQDE